MAFQNKKTTMKSAKNSDRKWFILDATGKTLGRFASEVAKILRGKHKPIYTAHSDVGDGVIVINAEKIAVTGAKSAQKIYRYHTGAMSGMREVPYGTMIERNPGYVIEHAVFGMIPRSRLGRSQRKRLRVYKGTEHDMQAQQPIHVNI